jgi:hypothetical protein
MPAAKTAPFKKVIAFIFYLAPNGYINLTYRRIRLFVKKRKLIFLVGQ